MLARHQPPWPPLPAVPGWSVRSRRGAHPAQSPPSCTSQFPRNLRFVPRPSNCLLQLQLRRCGEVAEWSNVPDSKSGVGATLPRVRIPPSPPEARKARCTLCSGLFLWRSGAKGPRKREARAVRCVPPLVAPSLSPVSVSQRMGRKKSGLKAADSFHWRKR